MLRFLGTLLLLAAVFGLGYYAGQRPVSELKQTVIELSRKASSISRSAVETTLGLERTLRRRQSLIDAKAKVVQAKAEILDHNLGNAAKELAEAEEYLDKAGRSREEGDRPLDLGPIIDKVRSIRADLAAGRSVSRNRLDELQKELDVHANRQ